MANKEYTWDKSSIVLYKTEDNNIQLEVKLEQDTVWLNTKQMAYLFGKEESNIRRHIGNVFKEKELERESNVHFLHVPFSDKPVPFYSLDVIISVGYRVHSPQGTQFRIWANRVLKQYLLKGYAINQKIQLQHYQELKDVVALMSRTLELQEKPTQDEYAGLFNVISDYVYALDTLDSYDYQELTIDKTTKKEPFHATYENAMEAITALKEKFGGSALFANEKDDSFKSSIGQIYQTFGGEELYPSVEEKAAMLLYLVTKNHSFSDGNKRIGDNTLVALTLMIAESRTEEKDIMVKVVVNLINQDNQ